MRPFRSQIAKKKSLRFKGSLPELLQDLANSGPLYIHARNWIGGLAAISPLTGLVIDEATEEAMFPEEGLIISLSEVEAVHGVTIDYRGQQALALEFATCGEPRSISIVAIPSISDMESFTRCMHRHPSEVLREKEYQAWREDFTVFPAICPCCMESVEERRANPELNPLTRIFRQAIHDEVELRCEVLSPLIGFSTWLLPTDLRFTHGLLSLIGRDQKSLLELDHGMCHSMRIVCRLVDDELFSEISLYDSIGRIHLRIGARGLDHEMSWRHLCGQ